MPVTTTVATGTTTTTTKLMEKPHQAQQQLEALRCPRCESSNTKFCYYNNYSLSQPRHFCKACKRYWTRGGTLRNVPVGGGCRKNKRVKRHASKETLQSRSAADIITTTTTTTSTSSTVGTNNIPPIYNFAASGPHPTGLSDFATSSAGLDLPPMLNSIWLNFPASTTDHHHLADYTGQNPNHIQLADTLNSSDHPYSLLNSTTSSLLTTTLHQQKLMMGLRDPSRPSSDFHLLFPMGDHLHQSTSIANVMSSSLFKGVKMDHDQEGLSMTIPCNTSNEAMAASDVGTYWGTANAGGVAPNWSEATSYGSSITPLI